MKITINILFLGLTFFWTTDLHALCVVRNSSGQSVNKNSDPLFVLLQNSETCPENVQDLKALLEQSGLQAQPYMVANRGIHNPTLGSFSFFEEVTGSSPILKNDIQSGEFFFGHFTIAQNGLIQADQIPSNGKLLIELIVWDEAKGLFNFYELIGNGKGAHWVYRGDSQDILADNALLYLNSNGPNFGRTLRCSACHTSGGPIMKEIAAPYNDWWMSSRPLLFAPNRISSEVENWVEKLGDASSLADSVKTGIEKLETSPTYQAAKQGFNFQVTLRPLFCETEINLESDIVSLETGSNTLQIPSASIVNPFLANGSISMPSSVYKQLLGYFNMKFPETDRQDADHGWLVPVKGYSDLVAIQSLVKMGIITDEFVSDVLSIDLENPLFSSKRCALLKLVPADGLANFADRLKSSHLPGASELYENLTNPFLTKNFHKQKAQDLLAKTQWELTQIDGQKQLFVKLLEGRQAVFNSEISKNPLGQILEPGFRVIFPTSQSFRGQ